MNYIRITKGLRYKWHALRHHKLLHTERWYKGGPFIIQQGWRCYTCGATWYAR